jgi:hypothetical protein
LSAESQLERRERNLRNAKALLGMSQTEGWKVLEALIKDAVESGKDRLCSLKLDAETTQTLRVEIGFKRWMLRFVGQATPELIEREEERLTLLREAAIQRQDSGLP